MGEQARDLIADNDVGYAKESRSLMCLAIPARIAQRLENSMAKVDIMGVSRTVSLDLVPEAADGDFVLVHAGFALQVIDEDTANETLELLKTLPFFAEDEGLLAEGA